VSWVRLGKILGVIAAIVVLFVVALGNSPLRAPVIAIAALALLVAGGNYLNDFLGIKRKAQEFNRPDRSAKDDDTK
jgi:hypothetical protein